MNIHTCNMMPTHKHMDTNSLGSNSTTHVHRMDWSSRSAETEKRHNQRQLHVNAKTICGFICTSTAGVWGSAGLNQLHSGQPRFWMLIPS